MGIALRGCDRLFKKTCDVLFVSICNIVVWFYLLRAKMKNCEYESVEQMEADLNLMFENAKRYNMPNSSIYKRAFRLQQILQVFIFYFNSIQAKNENNML